MRAISDICAIVLLIWCAVMFNSRNEGVYDDEVKTTLENGKSGSS